jgi:hypothetical protein
LGSKRVVVGAALLSAALGLTSQPVALAAQRLTKTREIQGGQTDTVTLKAGRARLPFGSSTQLRGRIRPAAQGETVEIVNLDTSRVVGSDRTDSDGRYSLRFAPRKNATLVARWLAVTSDRVELKVKPLIRLRLPQVRLFGRALVKGRIWPATSGGKITLKLNRYGQPVRTKRVRLRMGRYFSTRLFVPKPGTYRARAVLDNPGYLNGYKTTGTHTPPLPGLTVGSNSVYVNLLEKRLLDLGYYLPGHNWSFDYRTADAMRAFNKVQSTARVGNVDSAAWQRLANPVRPRPRFRSPDYHIEINQTKQVIFVVNGGKVRHTLHTSTGANGGTRDGSFAVHRKLAGYSGNRLYYPSYFDGLRAIHGWPEVPTFPASHGCSRVPMWAATWIYSKAPIGTRVYVYH